MASFYNLADQELFKKYQYLPQEKYRLGLTLPTDTSDDVVTDQGIVNTDAFANTGGGGDFNPAGNMFGEGTAVDPVYGNTYIDTVRREGPESREAIEALINAGGSAPGGLMPQEYGFQFTGTPTERGDVLNEFADINYDTDNIVQGQTMGGSYTDNMDYSKSAFDSLESENEKRGFLSKMFNRVGQIKEKLPGWAQAAVTALNPFSVIPSLLSGIGGGGPKYGIAGLTDQQKEMYDSLASQGMLFDSSGIMKTLTGKNFMGKGYLEGQQDIYNDLKEQGYDVDEDGNITFDGELLDNSYFDKKNYLKNKIKEAFTVGKGKTIKDTTITPELINEFIFENNQEDNTTGGDGSGDYDDNNQTNTGPVGPQFEDQSYADPGVDAQENQPGGDGDGGQQNNGGGGGASYGDAAETGAKDGFGYGLKKGGRVKYFYGGKV